MKTPCEIERANPRETFLKVFLCFVVIWILVMGTLLVRQIWMKSVVSSNIDKPDVVFLVRHDNGTVDIGIEYSETLRDETVRQKKRIADGFLNPDPQKYINMLNSEERQEFRLHSSNPCYRADLH